MFNLFQNTCELFKIVQDTMHSAKLTVQDLESELKKLVPFLLFYQNNICYI